MKKLVVRPMQITFDLIGFRSMQQISIETALVCSCMVMSYELYEKHRGSLRTAQLNR